MKYVLLAILSGSLLTFCKPPLKQKSITKNELLGTWYLNKWAPYHTLVFANSTVFVDNNIDTVFTLNYLISNDSIITWLDPGAKFGNRIIEVNNENLVLEGMHDHTGKLKYSRIDKGFK
jgi:hypothetical protein